MALDAAGPVGSFVRAERDWSAIVRVIVWFAKEGDTLITSCIWLDSTGENEVFEVDVCFIEVFWEAAEDV